jgi:hypothetical protein
VVYTLKEQVFKSLKDKRIEAQRAAERDGKPIVYPTPADFLAEDAEEPIGMAAKITDAQGRLWRLANIGGNRGVQRWSWDLRGSLETPSDPAPTNAGGGAAGGGRGAGGRGGGGGFGGGSGLTAVPPGQYTLVIGKREKGVFTPTSNSVTFNVLQDPAATTTVADREANVAFRAQASKLIQDISQATSATTEARTTLTAIIRVLDQLPAAPPALRVKASALDTQLESILRELTGDEVNSARGELVPIPIRTHASAAMPSGMLAPPSGSNREQYDIAVKAFAIEYAKLKPILEVEMKALDAELDRIGAPMTPGRLPR